MTRRYSLGLPARRERVGFFAPSFFCGVFRPDAENPSGATNRDHLSQPHGGMAMRLRALLRAAPRMPTTDRSRLTDLMRDVARIPPGDDVLPARLCSALQDSYVSLQPEGRLGFLSILARQDVDEDAVRRSCNAVLAASEEGRGVAAALQARAVLRESLRPASQRILERFAQHPGGLRFLVELRADLLAAMDAPPAPAAAASDPPDAPGPTDVDVGDRAAAERERWRGLDASLRQLLGQWFDAGLLELEQLTWHGTPAALLEKLMRYERVHKVAGWDDLQSRLGGDGRRLFAFTHPRMPGEPLVFIHCRLLQHVPGQLTDVLPAAGEVKAASGEAATAATAAPAATAAADAGTAGSASGGPANVAVFYSISSPFLGLRGVPLGRLLIKQVLATLRRDHPSLDTFVTLSPVPGFRAWLESRLARRRAEASDVEDGPSNGKLAESRNRTLLASPPSAAAYILPDEGRALDRLTSALAAAGLSPAAAFEAHGALLADSDDDEGAAGRAEAREALLSLCARYLLLAKKRQRALDPVAGFHLRNGARLLALHSGANRSVRGLRESGGIMANYEYRPESLEAHHSAYVSRGEMQASDSVWRLAGREGPPDGEERDSGTPA